MQCQAGWRFKNSLDIINMRLPTNSFVMVIYKLLLGHLHLLAFSSPEEGGGANILLWLQLKDFPPPSYNIQKIQLITQAINHYDAFGKMAQKLVDVLFQVPYFGRCAYVWIDHSLNRFFDVFITVDYCITLFGKE